MNRQAEENQLERFNFHIVMSNLGLGRAEFDPHFVVAFEIAHWIEGSGPTFMGKLTPHGKMQVRKWAA